MEPEYYSLQTRDLHDLLLEIAVLPHVSNLGIVVRRHRDPTLQQVGRFSDLQRALCNYVGMVTALGSGACEKMGLPEYIRPLHLT